MRACGWTAATTREGCGGWANVNAMASSAGEHDRRKRLPVPVSLGVRGVRLKRVYNGRRRAARLRGDTILSMTVGVRQSSCRLSIYRLLSCEEPDWLYDFPRFT